MSNDPGKINVQVTVCDNKASTKFTTMFFFFYIDEMTMCTVVVQDKTSEYEG